MLRGLVQVGLLSTLFAGSSLLAQHGGSGSAPAASHMGGAVHGPSSFSGSSRSFAPPALSPNRASQIGRSGHWPSWTSWNSGANYRAPVRQRYPYAYPGLYPGLLSYGYGAPVGYATGFDEGDVGGASGPDSAESGPAEASGPPPPEPQMAKGAPPLYRPAYQRSAEAPVRPQPATILIFKDGRPATQVHNYALTGATLWDLDGDTRHEIPLDTVDIAATVRANRDAGVDFALPSSR